MTCRSLTCLLCLLTVAACGGRGPGPDTAPPAAGTEPPAATDHADTGQPTLPEAVAPSAGKALPAPVPGRAETSQVYSRQPAPGLALEHPGAAADLRVDRENYRHVEDNPVRLALEDPISTFSIDVDTAAYSNVRRLLSRGALPPKDAVRVEELVNYFSYDYPAPAGGEAFNVVTELGPSPWHPDRRLLHIGIQGERLAVDELPPANLVFLIDVSGSMRSPDKLDLLKASMKLLLDRLDAADRVAIAVYAGAAGAVLEPTAGDRHATIGAAIDRLTAGGSTNGGAGIHLAYALARQSFIEDGINRVILATDGDFNVGTTSEERLEDLVSRQRESGVALTVLGFGTGNYNDALMQRLAQAGNGNAAYVDTLNEARKVLVDELSSTLAIIASDVKIQVEFNPAVVAEYRLLGYETRLLDREDFNDDRVDAGDIGAGHSVTALYEITLRNSAARRIEPLRYGHAAEPPTAGHAGELAFLRLRHKAPGTSGSRLIERPLHLADARDTLAATSDDFRFAAAVAGFGALLRGGAGLEDFAYDDVMDLASRARGTDPYGYRSEFLGLVRTARALARPAAVTRR